MVFLFHHLSIRPLLIVTAMYIHALVRMVMVLGGHVNLYADMDHLVSFFVSSFLHSTCLDLFFLFDHTRI